MTVAVYGCRVAATTVASLKVPEFVSGEMVENRAGAERVTYLLSGKHLHRSSQLTRDSPTLEPLATPRSLENEHEQTCALSAGHIEGVERTPA